MTPLTPPSTHRASGLSTDAPSWAADPSRPRVLIARLSAIGDTILTTPVACRLRDAFPNAHLTWVVEEKSAKFIVGHPALDETIVLPRGWFVSPGQVWSLRRRLHRGDSTRRSTARASRSQRSLAGHPARRCGSAAADATAPS